MTIFRSTVLLLALAMAGTSACGSGTSDAGSQPPVSSPAARPMAVAVLPSPSPSGARAGAASVPAASGLPTRVVIEDLGIDLPNVSGDLLVAGNPPDYPLCDVAQYLTTYRYPGRPGTATWIYAHAREGMFLSLLEASERADGRELIGITVDLYSDGPTRYRYEITDVVRHATDRGIARDVPSDGGRLVLQTSEGPRGTVPKLQIAARLTGPGPVDPAEAIPTAEPRVCVDD
ncbi:MAG TPA: hypothetical protein VFY23_15810 [Candidatus Limnocylindrales bacterium]|nr:hypothetical protein [Candidatus Limnocylindrales bacterium]